MPQNYKTYIDNLLISIYKTRTYLYKKSKKKLIFLIH